MKRGEDMNDHRRIRRHRGIFMLSSDLFAAESIRYNSGKIQHIMSYMIIVRCEHFFASSVFEYEAYSWLFRYLQEAESAPIYEIITSDDGWKVEVQEVGYRSRGGY